MLKYGNMVVREINTGSTLGSSLRIGAERFSAFIGRRKPIDRESLTDQEWKNINSLGNALNQTKFKLQKPGTSGLEYIVELDSMECIMTRTNRDPMGNFHDIDLVVLKMSNCQRTIEEIKQEMIKRLRAAKINVIPAAMMLDSKDIPSAPIAQALYVSFESGRHFHIAFPEKDRVVDGFHPSDQVNILFGF